MFYRLPTDLQICIVHSWLAGDERELLQALSRLICSTSRKTRKDDLRLLTSHCSDHWTATDNVDGIPERSLTVKDLPGLLRWLHRWTVPMKVLDLTDVTLPSCMDNITEQLQFHLTSVETIYLPRGPIDSIDAVLQLLPNLTAIHCSYVSSDNSTIWPLLKCFKGLQLKEFTAFSWSDPHSMVAFLQTFGQHMEELKLTLDTGAEFDMLQVIARHCPNLRLLYLEGRCEERDVVELLSACPNLTDLSLGVNGHVGDLKSILVNKQVKRFQLLGYDDNFNEEEDMDHPVNISYGAFGEIIAEHPSLESFNMPAECEYDRVAGYLFVYTGLLYMEEEVQALLRRCRPLRKIKMFIGHREVDGRALTIADGALGEDVEELEVGAMRIRNFAVDQLLAIPLQCPLLRKLVLDSCCCKLLSDDSLRALAAACPLLQHLSCAGIDYCPSFTDDAMLALFQGCAGLQVLRVDMATKWTFRTLQAIVDCRLCLKSLTVSLHKLTEDEFLQFRQLVKDAGLLPVVKIMESLSLL